jgi:hypothetical protein
MKRNEGVITSEPERKFRNGDGIVLTATSLLYFSSFYSSCALTWWQQLLRAEFA